MKPHFLIALMALMVAVAARSQADSLTVEGIVVNELDGNVLPLCNVQLFQEGHSVASALTDYDGRYVMPTLVAGSYTFLVTQFGDTMMCYKGLSLTQDTRVRIIVTPPPASMENLPLPPDDSNLVWLPEVSINGTRNLLYKMGLLITSPNDPRLWNLSGRMGSPAPASIATPLDEEGRYDISLRYMPETMKQLLTFGRKLYITPPIWVLCNEPWNPVPVAKKEPEKTEEEEQKKED